MKKTIAGVIVIAVICLVIFPSVVDASTGCKVKKTMTSSTSSINAGDFEMGTVTGTGLIGGTFSYIYSSGQYLTSLLLSSLQGEFAGFADYLSHINPGVGKEVAYHNKYLFGKVNGGAVGEYDASSLITSSENALGRQGYMSMSYSNNVTWSGSKTYTYDTSTSTTVTKSGNVLNSVANTLYKQATFNVSTRNVVAYAYVPPPPPPPPRSGDPLILDIKGNGKIEASGGKYLPHKGVGKKQMAVVDFFGNGFSVVMEWPGPNDGMLVAPKQDGSVDASCLFASNYGYENGFEKLSIYDKNNDNNLTGNELKGLSVWQDKNQNGTVDQGELKTVEELGITSISLVTKDFAGTFVRNGKTYKIWSWWPNLYDLSEIN